MIARKCRHLMPGLLWSFRFLSGTHPYFGGSDGVQVRDGRYKRAAGRPRAAVHDFTRMPIHSRRHRWIALVVLFGLLFQQLAMASYACPIESHAATASAVSKPPCHETGAVDQVRCHQHCHPQTPAPDHSPPLLVPPAHLPPTTWERGAFRRDEADHYDVTREVVVRATAPPLTIQHCTFQL